MPVQSLDDRNDFFVSSTSNNAYNCEPVKAGIALAPDRLETGNGLRFPLWTRTKHCLNKPLIFKKDFTSNFEDNFFSILSQTSEA